MSLLPQQNTFNQYVADGSTLIYTYSYYIPTPFDIDVYITPSNQQANDVADIQTLNVDYTVQNVGNIPGGTVTFLVAPLSGYVVTLNRNVQASIDTNYIDPKTIIGANLDNSFQREMLVSGQNKSSINERCLRYQFSSYVPNTTNKNVLPTLNQGYIWIGSAGGGVASAFLSQNPDWSTLRSELASETQYTDGASIVGFFDNSRLLPTTVAAQLNSYSSQVMGSDGASLIGYYDTSNNTGKTVAQALNELEATLFPSGTYRKKAVAIVDPGWAACDGSSYDMVGSLTTPDIQRLGNLFLAQGLVNVYGSGVDSYFTSNPSSGVANFQCVTAGVALGPNPYTSGFIMTITVLGAVGVQQTVSVFTTPGNMITPGAYFELNAPSGRSSVFWFQVDGVGTAPTFPLSLVQMVPILSSYDAQQVALAIIANSFLQYRVPLKNGLFDREWDNGAGVDPDASSRTNVYGQVVGDVVGSLQETAMQNHAHAVPPGSTGYIGRNGDIDLNSGGGYGVYGSSGYVSTTSLLSSEDRPPNMYVFVEIKF